MKTFFGLNNCLTVVCFIEWLINCFGNLIHNLFTFLGSSASLGLELRNARGMAKVLESKLTRTCYF